MHSSNNISIIVPHYNDQQRCAQLVDALLQLRNGNSSIELIVVDNGSKVSLQLPDVEGLTLLHCPTPGSYAARNLGVQHARGDVLIFTDSDCLPDTQWIQTISDFFAEQGNRDKVLAGRVQMYAAHADRVSFFEACDFLLGLDQERYVSKGYAVTANLSFCRHVYERVGGFDSTRFSGGDTAFVRAAVRSGFQLVYSAQAVVYHPARNSYAEYDQKARRVVGGQVRKGSLKTRIFYALRNLLPPVVEFFRLVTKPADYPVKLKAFGFLFVLWYMRATSTISALFSRTYLAR
ncbi:MAG: glycosyltransferase family 2 protein [Cellvibrionaceae bacterium]|nr:glycosyltransferase family 2 protein [Cellvibrionaceae bacterium]